jgi:hypothetical protein
MARLLGSATMAKDDSTTDIYRCDYMPVKPYNAPVNTDTSSRLMERLSPHAETLSRRAERTGCCVATSSHRTPRAAPIHGVGWKYDRTR